MSGRTMGQVYCIAPTGPIPIDQVYFSLNIQGAHAPLRPRKRGMVAQMEVCVWEATLFFRKRFAVDQVVHSI